MSHRSHFVLFHLVWLLLNMLFSFFFFFSFEEKHINIFGLDLCVIVILGICICGVTIETVFGNQI